MAGSSGTRSAFCAEHGTSCLSRPPRLIGSSGNELEAVAVDGVIVEHSWKGFGESMSDESRKRLMVGGQISNAFRPGMFRESDIKQAWQYIPAAAYRSLGSGLLDPDRSCPGSDIGSKSRTVGPWMARPS